MENENRQFIKPNFLCPNIFVQAHYSSYLILCDLTLFAAGLKKYVMWPLLNYEYYCEKNSVRSYTIESAFIHRISIYEIIKFNPN